MTDILGEALGPPEPSPGERTKIEFLIQRETGIPSSAFLSTLPGEERDLLASEDAADAHSALWGELVRLDPEALERRYNEELKSLEREAGEYQARILPSGFEVARLLDAWTWNEAVALWLGVTPRPTLIGWARCNFHLHPWAAEVVRRHDLVVRAGAARVLSDNVEPRAFVSWASRKPFGLPAELEELLEPGSSVEALRGQLAAAHKRIGELEEKLEDPAGIDSKRLLRMFGALCCEAFDFKIERQRNKATTKIMKVIEVHTGITSRPTVLRYVRAGIDALPKPSWLPVPDPDEGGAIDGKPAL